MKTEAFLLIIAVTAGAAFPEKLADISNIISPQAIAAGDKYVYITDKEKIHQLALKDARYIRAIGRKGQGPGEFPRTPKIKLSKDTLITVAGNKLLYFNSEGTLQQEIKLPFIPFKGVVEGAGSNYVSQQFLTGGEKGRISVTISLFGADFSRIKELYRLSIPPPTQKMSLVQPRTRFSVYNGRIYITQPAEGFVIEVFDTAGERLYRIEKNFEKIPIPESLKKEKIEIAKKQGQTAGYWEVVKDKISFPHHFPPIEKFIVTTEKIYVKTPKTRGGLVEFVIMDLEGKILKRTFLPAANDLFTIHQRAYYFLKENPDTERWEFHRQAIK